MEKLTEQVIIDIISAEMKLATGRAWVRDENKKIGTDNGLFVIAGLADADVYATANRMENVQTPGSNPPTYQFSEVSRVQTREMIQIDILSRSDEARRRRWEIIAALNSIYAKQTQEKYQFKIAQLPSSFANTSSAEGSSQINRFSTVVGCLTWQKITKELRPDSGQYYDNFTTRVDTEESIGKPEGIIEFNIKSEE